MGSGELTGDEGREILDRLTEFYRSIVNIEMGEEPKIDSSLLIKVTGLEKKYKSGGHSFALGPLDLKLLPGQITGVVGENGNGKTTLLNILASEVSPSDGKIEFTGFQFDPFSHYEYKQQIAFIPQRLMPWYGTLKQNLHFAASSHGIKGKENDDLVEFIIHRLGLTRFQNLTWKQLSSGYKLRFELAKMLVYRPKFLVLDEPIANLDLVAQQLFLQDLMHIAASTKYPLTIILSSQQLHQIEEVADQIVFLKNGKPLYVGKTNEFGKERESNSFEFSGEFNVQSVLDLFQDWSNTKIEENGVTITMHTSTNKSAQDVLKYLIENDISINYFRDISLSTRKLLSDTL